MTGKKKVALEMPSKEFDKIMTAVFAVPKKGTEAPKPKRAAKGKGK